MREILKENVLKNMIVLLVLALLYTPIENYLTNSTLSTDKATTGSVLVAAQTIVMIACFGAFAFTYEKINAKKNSHRLLGHLTTGILMLIIGMCLIFTRTLLGFLIGASFLIDLILVLLYLACIGFDFWDILKISE